MNKIKPMITVKVIFCLPLLLVLLTGFVWYPANERTVGWDAVTTYSDGDVIDINIVSIVYNTYMRDITTNVETLVQATITGTQHAFIFNTRGSYHVGVSSQLKLIETGELLDESPISWSDNVEVCQAGNTFGIRYFGVSANPKGLH